MQATGEGAEGPSWVSQPVRGRLGSVAGYSAGLPSSADWRSWSLLAKGVKMHQIHITNRHYRAVGIACASHVLFQGSSACLGQTQTPFSLHH